MVYLNVLSLSKMEAVVQNIFFIFVNCFSMCNWQIKELLSHSVVTFLGPVYSFYKSMLL